jgi:outer membrane protein
MRPKRSSPAVPALSHRGLRAALAPLAAAVALALGAAGARAQSLLELVEAARSYDASFLAAKASADAAQYKAAQADALNRPSAALSAGLSRAESDPPKSVSNPQGVRTGATSATAAIAGRYPLFNRANTADIDKAYKALDIAKLDVESAEQDLIVRVSQAYFDVLAAQDALATTQASKKAITEQLASAKRNFEVGTATITDTREAQARFDLATAQEIAAENDLRTKRIALDQLVGKSGVAPKTLVAPVVLPAVAPADAEAWVTQADEAHPGIRKARLAGELARLDTAKARAGNLPTVDAVARLGASNASSIKPALTPSGSGTTISASLGVELNMPLYTGGATDNAIKSSVALEEKARNDLESARRQVAQGTRATYFGVQSLQAQVKALEAAESSSKLALEATQLGYRVGVRVNLDVLNAQSQLYTTQRDLAKARYDVLVNSLKLRQTSGTLKLDDVRGVNALLAK